MTNQQQNMKATTATAFQEYKAAIALNNMGVTLLNRRRYNDALISFQNGFTLMNSSFKSNMSRKFSSLSCDNKCVNETSNNDDLNLSNHNEMLHQASFNLAQSSTVKTSKISPDDHFDLLLHPIILTADKTSNSIMDLLNLKPSTNNCYALRIDDVSVCDFDETVPVSDYMMEIGIILNNIGTAYRCYASETKSSSSSSSSKKKSKSHTKFIKLITSGLSFCNASRRILATMADIESTEDEIKRQGLLSLLILNNLMNLSADMRDIDNARQHYIDHGDLRSMLLTTLFEDNDVDENDSSKSNRHVSNDKVVGSCFYVDNESFHVTAAGAA